MLTTTLQHHRTDLGPAVLHHVAAGDAGSPVLLVHGFPESWWAFRDLLGPLAERHRVHAIDLRGFGDSDVAEDGFDAAGAAEDLHALVAHLGEGPVHLLAQDVGGVVGHRLAALHPEEVASVVLVEAGLPGFGAEAFADVAHGGAWHVGALASPGVPELLAGREHELVVEHLYAAYGTELEPADLDELVRGFARPGGLQGAAGLYHSLIGDGEAVQALAADRPLRVPALAVGLAGGAFTARTLEQVTAGPVEAVQLEGVGHYVAQEAPERLAEVVLAFWARVDDMTA